MTDRRFPRSVYGRGSEPDARFTLANERTFLAWVRTALAMLAGGIAADQFLTDLRWGVRTSIAVVLLLGGGVCAIRAVNHWVRCERAMRRAEDLPLSRFPAVLAVGAATAAVLVATAVAVGGLDR